MKTTVKITLLAIFTVSNLIAQNKKGVVKYKEQLKNLTMKPSSSNMDPVKMESIQKEIMKKMQKTFILKIDGEESMYEKNNESKNNISVSGNKGSTTVNIKMPDVGKRYTNINDKKSISFPLRLYREPGNTKKHRIYAVFFCICSVLSVPHQLPNSSQCRK